MQIDPYILAFSFVTVAITVWMGFRSAKSSKTASDFFVAGRSVGVGMNASAISGEYLSAASFMGIAGMVMSSGYDALWYPVCYACGYLFLLLFIAGPLRRFGAYTIPDFAEGRFDSPLFRKIAVVFVLFIGFFYTMPQMKGAGTTLGYIFQDLDFRGTSFEFLAPMGAKGMAAKGLNYAVGVFVVGAVITLNVALGGMKGITLVQAFQYWAKMFAISVPIFVLMAVYGHYGKQVGANGGNFEPRTSNSELGTNAAAPFKVQGSEFKVQSSESRLPLPPKAPADATWLNPFGPLTTKAAKTAAAAIGKKAAASAQFENYFEEFALNLKDTSRVSEAVKVWEIERDAGADAKSSAAAALDEARGFITSGMRTMNFLQAVGSYNAAIQRPVYWLRDLNNSWHLEPRPFPGFQVRLAKADYVALLESFLKTNGVGVVSTKEGVVAVRAPDTEKVQQAYLAQGLAGVAGVVKTATSTAFNTSGASAEKAWLAKHEKPLALLYTYSLIIAIVCGTAGLPHILVRFYTNPDGVAAKKTTMWVMILIGVFYVFPPVFGALGRNLLPDLYNGLGAKGTDKIVLELPRLLNEKYAPLGSILSGITCAGAFAAFMSTFSGLLVSMTGALAHDVYGRILRPQSTPAERMKMFKVGAVIIGGVAILLGMQVEQLQINFMVGQAFAIAAASYFPLLFMAVWWRNLTMIGAATGMLTGGISALACISLTSFSDLKWVDLGSFWAAHPLLRILCEQPAIWAVPLAIVLMIIVSKLTASTIPGDSRMKMLVLHAPEELGLKQEYIQEHQHGPGH